MSTDLVVRTGRLSVDPAELSAAAAILARQAARIGEITVFAAGVASDPVLPMAVALAPGPGVRAVEDVATVLHRAPSAAARLAGTAVQLRTAALAYEYGDALARAALVAARRFAGEILAELVPALVVGGGVVFLADVAVRSALLTTALLDRSARQLAAGSFDVEDFVAEAEEVVPGAVRRSADDALSTGQVLLEPLGRHPELVGELAAVTPDVVRGLVDDHPWLLPVVGGPAPRLLLPSTGAPDDVADDVAAVAGLVTGLRVLTPLFASTDVTVTPVATTPTTAGRGVPSRPPRGVAEILQGVRINSTGWPGGTDPGSRLSPAAPPPPGVVRIERVTHPGAPTSWIVEIPGTQDWTVRPRAGGTPMDLTANLDLVAGRPTAVQAGVAEAMRQAGIAPGEPVLLAGHSQGGITAAALAADPALRSEFTVTHVLTAGSPVDGIDVPAEVRVLQLEHDEDLVPELDGLEARGGAGRIVVSASGGDGLAAHESDAYLRTAARVDSAADPALRDYLDSAAPFLDAPEASVQAFDYVLVRR